MSERVDLSYNEDCFAFNNKKRSCEILKQFYSSGSYNQCLGCTFYKTREQHKSDLIQAAEKAREKYGRSSYAYETARKIAERMR